MPLDPQKGSTTMGRLRRTGMITNGWLMNRIAIHLSTDAISIEPSTRSRWVVACSCFFFIIFFLLLFAFKCILTASWNNKRRNTLRTIIRVWRLVEFCRNQHLRIRLCSSTPWTVDLNNVNKTHIERKCAKRGSACRIAIRRWTVDIFRDLF